jgi:hypothetical protein
VGCGASVFSITARIDKDSKRYFLTIRSGEGSLAFIFEYSPIFLSGLAILANLYLFEDSKYERVKKLYKKVYSDCFGKDEGLNESEYDLIDAHYSKWFRTPEKLVLKERPLDVGIKDDSFESVTVNRLARFLSKAIDVGKFANERAMLDCVRVCSKRNDDKFSDSDKEIACEFKKQFEHFGKEQEYGAFLATLKRFAVAEE